MQLLTVEEYDAAERAALETTPNRIVECCQPTTFTAESYPVRIASTRAAGRYVDVMHEGRSQGTFDALLGGITRRELDLFRAVATKIAAMTAREYGRRQVPRSAMLRALNVVRHVRYLYPDPPATILEIGAGSGYIGALLAELGYRYVSTDITQAFYLYQSHMLASLLPGRLIELATDPRTFLDLGEIPAGYAVHVPWWKYMTVGPSVLFKADVVTCNHALCEMHSNALRYTAKVSHAMLRERNGCFLFEGWGSTVRHPIWHAGRALSMAGFAFAHNDVHASILVGDQTAAATGGMKLPPPGAEGDGAFHPSIHVNPANEIGAKVLAGRESTAHNALYDLEDLDAALQSIAGDTSIMTADERFMEFVADDRR
jgi:SAM-dependent methyltransferase